MKVYFNSSQPIPIPKALHLPDSLHAQMQTHVERLLPQEACGLVGGFIQDGISHARLVITVTNSLHSTIRFFMEPAELLAAFNTLDAQGLQLVSIFHSHPLGPAQPSPTDIAEAYYPEAVYLIWSKQSGVWECSGFTIQAGSALKVGICIVNETP